MASGVEERVLRLGIQLPSLRAPDGNYLSAKTVGKLVFPAGAISSRPDAVIAGTAGLDGQLSTATERPALAH